MKHFIKVLTAAVILTASVNIGCAYAAEPPTIYYSADTTMPGECAMVFGGPFAYSATTVKIGRVTDSSAQSPSDSAPAVQTWQTVKVNYPPFSAGTGSYEAKFDVPSSLAKGIYAFKITSNGAESDLYFFNKPKPWWIQGDKGKTASPGGYMRIQGKCLAYDGKTPRVMLRSADGTDTWLAAEAYKENSLSVRLPENTAVGEYEVYVSNGYGDASCISRADNITIEQPNKKSSEIFSVLDYGADPTGNRDSTSAVQKALNAAKSKKGRVFLPAGSYMITQPLRVGEGTEMFGEDKNLSMLFVPEGKIVTPYLIYSPSAGPVKNLNINNLSVYMQGAHKNIIYASGGFDMSNVIIRALGYYGHINKGEKDSDYGGSTVTSDPINLGCAVILRDAESFSIDSCDILATNAALNSYNSRYGIIKDCTLSGTLTPMQNYGLSKTVFENNLIKSTGLFSSGSSLSLYNSAASFNVFMYNNTFENAYGGDREAITFDGHGTAYLGKVTETSGTTMTLVTAPQWGTEHKDKIASWDTGLKYRETDCEWHGVTVYIINGTGVGQYRNLVGCDGNEIEIEKAWDIEPDEDSIISIGKFSGRDIFLENKFYDVGTGVQLYPPNVECVVSGNIMERAGNTLSGGQVTTVTNGDPRAEVGWFSTFTDNVIAVGNSWGQLYSSIRIYGNNDVDTYPVSRGHIIKGNTIKSNGAVIIIGMSSDIIIEKNSYENSDTSFLTLKYKNKGPSNMRAR